MKSPLLTLALVIALPILRAVAQQANPPPLPDPTLDALDALDIPPLPAPSKGRQDDLMNVLPEKRIKPSPSLMPDGIDPAGRTDKTKPGALPKGRSTYRPPTTSTDLDLRIRYRQAQSRVLDDPSLKALWQQSRGARTDYARREALRSYYQLMFQKMVATDKGLLPLVQERQRYTMNRLDQNRVEPTDPADQ